MNETLIVTIFFLTGWISSGVPWLILRAMYHVLHLKSPLTARVLLTFLGLSLAIPLIEYSPLIVSVFYKSSFLLVGFIISAVISLIFRIVLIPVLDNRLMVNAGIYGLSEAPERKKELMIVSVSGYLFTWIIGIISIIQTAFFLSILEMGGI